jgi:RNA polymerase sigma-70 factor (ECF subfamily)
VSALAIPLGAFDGAWPFALFAAPAAPAAPERATDGDAAIVARALGGDRRAFDELYRLHVDRVARLMARLVGAPPDREDLVQQVFLEAFRALDHFRGEAAFGTWLYRIAVNVAHDHLRRVRRRPDEAIPDAALDQLVAPTEDPEQTARQRQELARALALLDKLKPKKRIAFVLRTVEGLSLDEIGAMVGAAAPAVGQRVKHAQRELATMIARQERAGGAP